jgi:hypothetical protein
MDPMQEVEVAVIVEGVEVGVGVRGLEEKKLRLPMANTEVPNQTANNNYRCNNCSSN